MSSVPAAFRKKADAAAAAGHPPQAFNASIAPNAINPMMAMIGGQMGQMAVNPMLAMNPAAMMTAMGPAAMAGGAVPGADPMMQAMMAGGASAEANPMMQAMLGGGASADANPVMQAMMAQQLQFQQQQFQDMQAQIMDSQDVEQVQLESFIKGKGKSKGKGMEVPEILKDPRHADKWKQLSDFMEENPFEVYHKNRLMGAMAKRIEDAETWQEDMETLQMAMNGAKNRCALLVGIVKSMEDGVFKPREESVRAQFRRSREIKQEAIEANNRLKTGGSIREKFEADKKRHTAELEVHRHSPKRSRSRGRRSRSRDGGGRRRSPSPRGGRGRSRSRGSPRRESGSRGSDGGGYRGGGNYRSW